MQGTGNTEAHLEHAARADVYAQFIHVVLPMRPAAFVKCPCKGHWTAGNPVQVLVYKKREYESGVASILTWLLSSGTKLSSVLIYKRAVGCSSLQNQGLHGV
jgi:hypothetical protein